MVENIKAIGKRCSILVKDNVFSLVIMPTEQKKKVLLLLIWLLAWTIGGVIIIANYNTLSQQSSKLFVIIWLGFWAYFEYKIVTVYVWKQFGKEKFWIKNGTIYYQQYIKGTEKIDTYVLELASDFHFIPLDNRNYKDVFAQSFWVKGGERIEFTCQNKVVKIGMQLNDEDTNQIIFALKKYCSKKK
jgi:hypothetical protein